MAAVLTGLAASGPLILKAIELIEAFSAAFQTLKRVDAIASITIMPLAVQCDEHLRAVLAISHISAQDLYTAVSKFVTGVVPVIESEEHELSHKLEETRQAADEICALAKKDNLSIQKGFDNVKNALQTICEELCHTQSSIVEDAERPLKDLGDHITQLVKAISPSSPVPLSFFHRFLISLKEFMPALRPREADGERGDNCVSATHPSPVALEGDCSTTVTNGSENTMPMGPIPEPIAHEPNYRDFVIRMIDEFNSILGFFKESAASSAPQAIRSAAVNNKEREEHIEKLTKLKHDVQHKTSELGVEKHEIEELIKVFSSLSGKVCQFSKLWGRVYGDLMSLSKYLDDPQNPPANDEDLLTRVKMEQGKYKDTMVTLKSYETHVVVEAPKAQ